MFSLAVGNSWLILNQNLQETLWRSLSRVVCLCSCLFPSTLSWYLYLPLSPWTLSNFSTQGVFLDFSSVCHDLGTSYGIHLMYFHVSWITVLCYQMSNVLKLLCYIFCPLFGCFKKEDIFSTYCLILAISEMHLKQPLRCCQMNILSLWGISLRLDKDGRG